MVQGFGGGAPWGQIWKWQAADPYQKHPFSYALLPLCYSTHKSSFCEEEREYNDGHPSLFLLQLVGKTDACQRILIKNTPDVVRRPACFVVKGVQGWGGGFAEILRLRSQLFWHSLSHIRRFSPLRVNLYKERSPIKNHSRPFLRKGQTSEARRGWHPRVWKTASRANLRPFGAPPSKGRREKRGVCWLVTRAQGWGGGFAAC